MQQHREVWGFGEPPLSALLGEAIDQVALSASRRFAVIPKASIEALIVTSTCTSVSEANVNRGRPS